MLAAELEGPPEAALSEAQRQTLANAAADRFALLLTPDFDRYLALRETQLGFDTPEMTASDEARTASKRQYEGLAARWSGGCVDPGVVRLVARAFGGQSLQSPPDPAGYRTTESPRLRLRDPVSQRFPVYDIYQPWRADAFTADRQQRTVEGWHIMSFAWDNSRSTWQIWRVTFSNISASTEPVGVVPPVF